MKWNVHQLIIRNPDTDTIRFTRAGQERFARRFARSGFDIRAIKTMAQFQVAYEATFEREIRDELAKSEPDPELRHALRHLPFLSEDT